MNASEQADINRQQSLEYWKRRTTMTNQDFIEEYCNNQREKAKTQVGMVEDAIKSQKDIFDYIKKHGTDEG